MSERIPDFQRIMYPLLRYLGDDQPRNVTEVVSSLAGTFKLTEEDLRIKLDSGIKGKFRDRVGWATTYLKNSGLIFYPQRGVYQITAVGKEALADNITEIDKNYLKKFEGYQKWLSTSTGSGESDTADRVVEGKTPEEILGDTVRDLKNTLGYELLELLKNKPPEYFEYFVLKLLSAMGYGGVEKDNFEVVGQSGDNGIDGIIYQDKLGIDRIYVQAKRWRDNKVQSKDIRDFIGSLSLRGTNKGIFITTSEFTQDAVQTAKMNPHNRIILINGVQLVENAIDNNVGVQVKKSYEIKDLDNDFFDDL
jgi:restriction system protein